MVRLSHATGTSWSFAIQQSSPIPIPPSLIISRLLFPPRSRYGDLDFHTPPSALWSHPPPSSVLRFCGSAVLQASLRPAKTPTHSSSPTHTATTLALPLRSNTSFSIFSIATSICLSKLGNLSKKVWIQVPCGQPKRLYHKPLPRRPRRHGNSRCMTIVCVSGSSRLREA